MEGSTRRHKKRKAARALADGDATQPGKRHRASVAGEASSFPVVPSTEETTRAKKLSIGSSAVNLLKDQRECNNAIGSPVETTAQKPLGGKTARKLKKKERERKKKQKLREAALARKGGSQPIVSGSEKEALSAKVEVTNAKAGTKMSKRMKKRENWKAKHPSPAPTEVTPQRVGATIGKESEQGGKGKSKAGKADNAGKGDKVGKARSSSVRQHGRDDDSWSSDIESRDRRFDVSDSEPEEQYLGRRARKNSGKGGGKTRGPKVSKGGPAHTTKRERRAKKQAKEAENADTGGKKLRRKGKEKGKGKGKMGGTRKERRSKLKGKGKGKGSGKRGK